MLNWTTGTRRYGNCRLAAVVAWCGVTGHLLLAGGASPLPEAVAQAWQVAGIQSVSPVGTAPFCKVSLTSAEMAEGLLAPGQRSP